MRIGIRFILYIGCYKASEETPKHGIIDSDFHQVGKEYRPGIIPYVNSTFPAFCKLRGELESRFIDDVGRAAYFDCEHRLPPEHGAAVPAHISGGSAHDFIDHTCPVEFHIRRHNDDMVMHDGRTPARIAPACERGTRKRVGATVATTHGTSQPGRGGS